MADTRKSYWHKKCPKNILDYSKAQYAADTLKTVADSMAKRNDFITWTIDVRFMEADEYEYWLRNWREKLKEDAIKVEKQ